MTIRRRRPRATRRATSAPIREKTGAAAPARPADLARHLRGPLTLILGPLADALDEAPQAMSESQRRRIQLAHRATLRLRALVDAVAGAGDRVAPAGAAEAVDLSALTARAARDFDAVAEGAGVTIAARCAPLARAARVEREAWERLVHVLLAAAMGSPTGGAIFLELTEEGGAARLDVRGPGFASASAAGDPPALSAARDTAAALGGGATLAGGTLTVRVPLSDVEAPAPPEAPATFGGGTGETLPRVLLAADDADLRAYVGRLLAERWPVDAVATTEAALVLAAHRVPDLVVADAGGGLDALSLVLALRADPRTRRAPIVLLAPPGFEDRRGREVGADELVTLPFTARDLASRVAAHLELARLRDEATRREQALRMGAEAANRAKDEFIAMISHELRTPLGAILIWAQLLKGEELDQAATSRAVGMIERSTRTLAQLIDDLLDVSRIIAGKLTIESRSVDLRGVVEQALEAAQPAAAAKNLVIEKALDPAIGMVIGDASRLQQVVGNLLANAVKFTPEGGRIELRVERAGDHARVQVSDTGAGINPDFLPFIFDRFRQADTSSTRKQKGLGLGLSIARHIVEMHGGSIEATSGGEARGSTFTVTLPLAHESSRLDAAAAAEGGAGGDTLTGLRVLVVDDEADAREAMVVLLGQAGATVTSVGSAPEALDALRREMPDVLLSDIAMPGEDGYALMRRVRALAARDGGAVPAAALTAYASADDRRRALECGYDEHIAKPVDPVRLVATVATLARRRGAA
jgi:signal transduction histidine kinase